MERIISVVSWTLTLLALLFFILQFAKSKGTRAHIVRGISIPLLIIAVIVNNTVFVSSSRGLVWDASFIVHTFFGGLGFFFLVIAIIRGFQTRKEPWRRMAHRGAAQLSVVFFGASIVVAIIVRLIR